jgi:hypothetical protein
MPIFIPFTRDGEIAAIGRGLFERTLPKPAWTHAAHVAAGLWVIACRPELDALAVMPGVIRAYNKATGVANTDSGGYHATITLASLKAIRAFHADSPPAPLFRAANALMASPLGDPDWLLAYWSETVLFSVTARRGWVEPDLRVLPF